MLGAGHGTTVNAIYEGLKAITVYARQAINGPPKLGETRAIYLDARKAKHILGWEPQVGLREGLESTVDYFRKEEVLA